MTPTWMWCCRRARTGRPSSAGPLKKEEGFDVALKGAASPLPARTGTVASVTSVSPVECLVLD